MKIYDGIKDKTAFLRIFHIKICTYFKTFKGNINILLSTSVQNHTYHAEKQTQITRYSEMQGGQTFQT